MTKPTKWHVRPVWSESSLSVWRKLGSLANHWAHSKDSDQTGWMPRLIWVFAGHTVILLVLPWGSSNTMYNNLYCILSFILSDLSCLPELETNSKLCCCKFTKKILKALLKQCWLRLTCWLFPLSGFTVDFRGKGGNPPYCPASPACCPCHRSSAW